MSIGFLEGRVWIERRGLKWWVQPQQFIDATIMSRDAWEPPSTKVFESMVGAGMNVLDLGANTGYYTVLAARLVGPSGKVIAVEAMGEPLVVLREQCGANVCSNVSVVHAAIDDHDGDEQEAFFNYSWSLPGGDGTTFVQKKGAVPFRTVDRIVRDVGLARLDFVKVDLDGYDARAMRGAEDTLRRFRPRILLEVCDYTLRQVDNLAPDYVYGTEVRRMLSQVQALGYRFLWEEDLLPVASIEDPLSRFTLNNRSINLVAVPS